MECYNLQFCFVGHHRSNTYEDLLESNNCKIITLFQFKIEFFCKIDLRTSKSEKQD